MPRERDGKTQVLGMTLVGNIIFYAIVAAAVGLVLQLVRTKRSHFILGVFVCALGGAALCYSYLGRQPRAEDYPLKEIQYRKVTLNQEENKIVLADDCCQYEISRDLLAKTITLEQAFSVLQKTSQAKVWVVQIRHPRMTVRGFETENLKLPLTQGLELDRPGQAAFVGWLLLGLGVAVVATTYLLTDEVMKWLNYDRNG